MIPTPDPLIVKTDDFATGNATHLGQYTLEAHDVTDGAFTITAANGDTTQGTYEGTAAPTAVEGVITSSSTVQ